MSGTLKYACAEITIVKLTKQIFLVKISDTHGIRNLNVQFLLTVCFYFFCILSIQLFFRESSAINFKHLLLWDNICPKFGKRKQRKKGDRLLRNLSYFGLFIFAPSFGDVKIFEKDFFFFFLPQSSILQNVQTCFFTFSFLE